MQVVDKGDEGALGHWLQRGDDGGWGDDSGVDRGVWSRKAMMNMVDWLDRMVKRCGRTMDRGQ